MLGEVEKLVVFSLSLSLENFALWNVEITPMNLIRYGVMMSLGEVR